MREWFRAQRYVVFWAEDGRRAAPAEEFMDLLKLESDQVASKVANIEASIRRFAEVGVIKNPTKFKALGNGTVEFKAHGVRIFAALGGRVDGLGRLVLTHGVKKKKGGALPDIVETILDKQKQDPDWSEDE